MGATQNSRHRWFQFSIREWLMLICMIALGLGWWNEYRMRHRKKAFVEMMDGAIEYVKAIPEPSDSP